LSGINENTMKAKMIIMTNFVEKERLLRKIDLYRNSTKSTVAQELLLKLRLTITSGQLDMLTEGED
jgi:hypothetical protein